MTYSTHSHACPCCWWGHVNSLITVPHLCFSSISYLTSLFISLSQLAYTQYITKQDTHIVFSLKILWWVWMFCWYTAGYSRSERRGKNILRWVATVRRHPPQPFPSYHSLFFFFSCLISSLLVTTSSSLVSLSQPPLLFLSLLIIASSSLVSPYHNTASSLIFSLLITILPPHSSDSL